MPVTNTGRDDMLLMQGGDRRRGRLRGVEEGRAENPIASNKRRSLDVGAGGRRASKVEVAMDPR